MINFVSFCSVFFSKFSADLGHWQTINKQKTAVAVCSSRNQNIKMDDRSSGRSSPDYTYDSDLDPEFIPPTPKKIKKKVDLVGKSKCKPKSRPRPNNNNTFTRTATAETQETVTDQIRSQNEQSTDTDNESDRSINLPGPSKNSRSKFIPVEEVIEIIATIDSDFEDEENGEPENEIDLGLDLEEETLADTDSQDLEPDDSVHEHGDGANQFNVLDRGGWTDNLVGFPKDIPFTGAPGLSADIETTNYDALSCYKLFITDGFVRLLKEETNRYAALLKTLQPYRDRIIVKKWKTVTVHEMEGFLLILLHMGAIKKPSLPDYWSTKDFMKSSFSHMIMSRDRFRAILTMLHFSDNADYIPQGQPNHDPLYKIKKVYEHFQNRFSEVYTPLQDLSLDEAMCPWRGPLRFKVYMKDKPTKWGIKLYEVCEAESSYVCGFEIYAAAPNVSNKPTDVVLRILEDSSLLNKGYSVFTDNYYTCPELYSKLVQNKTHCTGTVRQNRRGMPVPAELTTTNVGDTAFRRKENLVCLKWKDKREVCMLTSAINPTLVSVVNTRHVQGKRKPTVVDTYSKKMGGVDKSDQLMSYFPLARRTSKWTTKLFMHLFTLSVVQSSIIYNKLQALNGKKKMALPQYIKLLGKELTEAHIVSRPDHRPPPKDYSKPSIARLVSKPEDFHSLEPLPATNSKAKPRRECKVCRDSLQPVEGVRKRSKDTHY